MRDPIPSLQASFHQHANPKTREWWEKYIKGATSFRGVGIPGIRKLIATWREEQGVDRLPEPAQLEIALRLFEYPMAEDKLAGILFLQDYLYDGFAWDFLLDRYAQLYSRELIFDWNTCDWFCVRVLGPTIARHTPQSVALADVRKSINFCKTVQMPILGVVENMSGFICPHCEERVDIFSTGAGEQVAREFDLPFLGRAPMDPRVVVACDTGQPYLSSGADTPATKAFSGVVDAVVQRLPAEKPVSLKVINPLASGCGCGPTGCDPNKCTC